MNAAALSDYLNAKRYMEHNVAQCWECQNQIGARIVKIDGVFYKLPECKVEDKYMLRVYDNLCKKYKRFGGTAE